MQTQALSLSSSINIFISFVPSEERTLRSSLVKALSPLTKRGLINLWSDEAIQVGQQREAEIRSHLQVAQVILLLVSPACVDSSYWYQQMEVIMERKKSTDVQVIPVILRPIVDWQGTPFGHLASLPIGGKPVTSFTPQEEAWFEVAKSIHKLVARPQANPLLTISRQLRTQPPTPHPTTSVPRPHIVTEIYQRLTSSEVSALVLTGVWGLGKSALAAQVCQFAEQQRQAGQGPFLGATLWLDIDPTISLLDVLVTLCQAHEITLPAIQPMTPYNLVAALLTVLQNSQQPRLIVLNQLENWLHPQTRYPRAEYPGVGELLELLNSQLCASRILCTSRIYPHGKSQLLEAYVQRFALVGLTLTEGLQLLRLGQCEETDEILAAAVTYYQGHPLALTLLRNLLKEDRSLSLATLLQDLSYRQLLVNDMAENVLHYIYTQQLSQEQRELLLAFAIYRQAVPLQAAQSIAQDRVSLSYSQASTALRVMLNHDLIQATGNLEYRLQPVIKDFVLAQMSDPLLDAEQRRQAHRVAATNYQERFSNALHGTTQPYMDDVRPLLEAAWHYCQAGLFAEAYHLIRHEQLFFYLHRWGGNSLLLDLYQHLLPPEKWEADVLVVGHIYHEMGTIQNALGQKQKAQVYYERALPFFRQAGQPVQIAEALNNLGTVYRALKQYTLAENCYQEAWSLCEQAGERFAQRGTTLNNQARLLYEQGQHMQQSRQKEQARTFYLKALACYEQALSAHRSNSLPEEEGWTLLNLGDVTASLGERHKAHDYYLQALKQFRDLGERRGEGTVLNNLGLLLAHNNTGNEQPSTYYIQSLHIFRAVGDRWQERKTLRNLGRWLLIHAPRQEPEHSQSYLRGLACFFCARDVLEERHTTSAEIIPGWLLASLNQDLGEPKMQEILKEAETKFWQIIEELLNMPLDFV